MPPDELRRRQNHPWSAKPALERISLDKGSLELGNASAFGRSFDSLHFASGKLHREHQATARDATVDHDRTRAADAMLAADMRARQPQFMSNKIRSTQARRHGKRKLASIYRNRNANEIVHQLDLRS